MDHPCHKCGHDIEDGKAFCSHCGAPQIRVVVAEAAALPVEDLAVPVHPLQAESDTLGVPALRAGRSNALQACGLAAVVSFGLTLLGLNFLVAALAAGFLAVAFTRRRSPDTLIRGISSARLGAFSGLLFFGILAILNILAKVVLHQGAEVRTEQLENLQRWAARYPSPGAQSVLDFAKTPDGFAILTVASVIIGFIVVVVLSSCGGALAATFLGRRNRR